jgi:O-antigen/teichoic acid export membrane protein
VKADRAELLGDARKLAGGGSAMLLGSLFGNGLSYLYALFLARSLGAADFGVYALGLAIFNVAILIAPLGFETGALRFISHALGREDQAGAQRTTVQVMTLVLASSVLMALLLALGAHPLAIRVYGQPALAAVLLWVAAGIPLAVFSTVLLDVIRSFQLVRYTVLVKYLWEPCTKFLLAAVLIWAGWAVAGVLAGLLVTLAGSVVIALAAARRVTRLDTGRLPALTTRGLRSLFTYCAPLTVSSVLGVIAPRSDVLILGVWVSAKQVGIYSVASQTAAILALVLAAFTAMSTPMIGHMAARQDLPRLESLYTAVARWTSVCTVPLFCLFALFGSDILAMFGKDFPGGTAPLVILALGQVTYSITGLASTVLLMFGHSATVMRNTVVLCALLIVSNCLLVPRWGMIGAATAVSLTLATVGAISVWQVHALYRIHPFTRALFKPLIAGALATLIVLSARSVLPATPLPLLVALGALAYLLSLFSLRIEPVDRQMLGTIVARIRPVQG